MYTLWKLFQLDSSIELNRDSLGGASRQTERLKRDLATAEEAHEQGKKELASLHRDLLKDERALKKKEHAIEDKKPSLVSIDEKISHTERSLQNLKIKKEAVEKDRKNYEKEVKSYEKDLDTVRKAAAKFEDDQKKKAQQSGVMLSDADLAEYRRLREESIKQGASEKSKFENIKRQLQSEKEVREDLKSKEDQADMKKKSISEEIRILTETHDNWTSKVNDLTAEIAGKRKDLDGLRSDRTRRELKKTELNEKLQQCLNRIQQMNYDLRETEREKQQRETLATLKRVYPAVRGRVSDLCKPTQNRYTLAVETIIGRHMNSIVVDTEKCATECIHYLQSARLPVRTFIPLDTIMTKPVNANLRSIHKNAKLGIDVINYERVHERAMAYVFGNAVVCDTYNVAKEITVTRGNEVKCVCLDGTVINKNGTITGGQSKQSRTGHHWEEQEAESLAKVRDDLIAQLSNLGSDAVGREDELKADVEILDSSLKHAQQQLAATQRTRSGKQEELKHVEKEISSLKPQIKKSDTEITKLQKELTAAADAWHKVEDKIFDQFCKKIKVDNIRVYEEQQGGLAKETASQRSMYSRQISVLQGHLTFEQERLQETNERLKKLTAGINRDKTQLVELKSEKEQIEEDIRQSQEELAALKVEHEKAKAKYETFQGKVGKLKKNVDAVRTNIDNQAKEIAVHETEIERAATERYTLLRKCKLEEIDIPLAQGSIDSVPINADFLIRGDDPDSMDVDDDTMLRTEIPDWGIEIDYDSLSDSMRKDDPEELERELLKKVKDLSDQLEHMAPNMKAVDRLNTVTDRLKETDREFEEARKKAKTVKDRFLAVKQER
jgi:structural maintenance of chromosome 1